MLQNTFIHLPGIGAKKEKALWESGILTWDDYLNAFPAQKGLFEGLQSDRIESGILNSMRALEAGDIDYFAQRLPKGEHYRIVLTIPDQTAFLDIETTGLSFYYDSITIVGYSIGDRYHCYIQGTDKREGLRALRSAKCLVTFNGTNFDLKFLDKEFSDFRLPKAHVDLRYLARTIEFSGGQKSIETQMGMKRSDDIAELDGERAPLLWHDYRMGDNEAGRTLVHYNFADIEGMKFIFDHTVENLRTKGRIPRTTKIQKFVRDRYGQISFTENRRNSRKNRIYVPRYLKKRGPKITLAELMSGADFPPLRIVGIDLTGSAKRPSGWALIDGNQAQTSLLNTDADLLVNTINCSPDLVSIDSPLSLPEGRTTVSDDDPRRDEIGIMRQCERTLKRRGVNVYPCLIPSMQRLTARGIQLADQFRAIGLPVIESYPGAAQDIMDIPRKRSGLSHLAKGLRDFGVRGDFENNGVSHDELDAITSAVVGLFFWSGRFEALGNENEDYLIIPDLSVSPKDWIGRRVVGVSGPIAAGKTTTAQYFKSKDFAYGRYSMVLNEILGERGIPSSRENLQRIGEEINRFPGQRWLSHRVANSLKGNNLIVIDGMRFPEDHATLIEQFGPAFQHLHVDASRSVRRARYRNQRRGNRVTDFDAVSEHPVEKKVMYLQKLAHNKISNDGDKNTLTQGLAQFISTLNLPSEGC